MAASTAVMTWMRSTSKAERKDSISSPKERALAFAQALPKGRDVRVILRRAVQQHAHTRHTPRLLSFGRLTPGLSREQDEQDTRRHDYRERDPSHAHLPFRRGQRDLQNYRARRTHPGAYT